MRIHTRVHVHTEKDAHRYISIVYYINRKGISKKKKKQLVAAIFTSTEQWDKHNLRNLNSGTNV